MSEKSQAVLSEVPEFHVGQRYSKDRKPHLATPGHFDVIKSGIRTYLKQAAHHNGRPRTIRSSQEPTTNGVLFIKQATEILESGETIKVGEVYLSPTRLFLVRNAFKVAQASFIETYQEANKRQIWLPTTLFNEQVPAVFETQAPFMEQSWEDLITGIHELQGKGVDEAQQQGMYASARVAMSKLDVIDIDFA